MDFFVGAAPRLSQSHNLPTSVAANMPAVSNINPLVQRKYILTDLRDPVGLLTHGIRSYLSGKLTAIKVAGTIRRDYDKDLGQYISLVFYGTADMLKLLEEEVLEGNKEHQPLWVWQPQPGSIDSIVTKHPFMDIRVIASGANAIPGKNSDHSVDRNQVIRCHASDDQTSTVKSKESNSSGRSQDKHAKLLRNSKSVSSEMRSVTSSEEARFTLPTILPTMKLGNKPASRSTKDYSLPSIDPPMMIAVAARPPSIVSCQQEMDSLATKVWTILSDPDSVLPTLNMLTILGELGVCVTGDIDLLGEDIVFITNDGVEKIGGALKNVQAQKFLYYVGQIKSIDKKT